MEVDEDIHDDQPPSHRSPAFTRAEINTLLNYIEAYKAIVLKKCNSGPIVRAKESVWKTIARKYNTHGYHTRTPEGLRMKWVNLKKSSKKVYNNVLDLKTEYDCDDIMKRVVDLMYEADRDSSGTPSNIDEIIDANEEKDTSTTRNQTTDQQDTSSTPSFDGMKEILDASTSESGPRSSRSTNFTPEETSLLLQCVRVEKNVVFNKESNKRALLDKHRAWKRITEDFNSRSDYKRSMKVLHTRFTNLKNLSRRFKHTANKQNGNTNDDSVVLKKKIKEEPVNHVEVSIEFMEDDNMDAIDNSTEVNGGADDPLTTLTNGVMDSDDCTSNKLLHNNRACHSLKLSEEETKLLVRCVNMERDIIFSKDKSTATAYMQHRAWKRITELFNKRSRHKRPMKVLQNKLYNLNKRKLFDSKDKLKLSDLITMDDDCSDVLKNSKAKPYDTDSELDMSEADGFNDSNATVGNGFSNCTGDPLSTVLNSTEDFNIYDRVTTTENQEVVRLKIELLKYQLETAKVERQRVQELLESERAERELRRKESELRVRAAQLAVAAAEEVLPPGHATLASQNHYMSNLG